MSDARPTRLTLISFGILAVIGGANSVAIRFSNEEFPPFFGAGLRFAAASLLFFIVVWIRRLPLPRGRALGGALVFGFFGFGASYAFVYWGLLDVPAGSAQVLLASVPLLTLFAAVLHRQERFHWPGLAGGMLAIAGVAVMIRAPLETAIPVASVFAILASAVCIAESIVVARAFPRLHLAVMNAVAMATGAALLFLLSLAFRETPGVPHRGTTWLAFSYLVVVGSVAVFALTLFILKRWTASATSYLFVLFPVSAVALSSWLDHEPVTGGLLIGGALVLAGVYVGALANRASLGRAADPLQNSRPNGHGSLNLTDRTGR